jgi:hypothetical protein
MTSLALITAWAIWPAASRNSSAALVGDRSGHDGAARIDFDLGGGGPISHLDGGAFEFVARTDQI